MAVLAHMAQLDHRGEALRELPADARLPDVRAVALVADLHPEALAEVLKEMLEMEGKTRKNMEKKRENP